MRPYREPYCEEHRQPLNRCRWGDSSCAVCGCGGLCDPGMRCQMARRPTDEERASCRAYPAGTLLVVVGSLGIPSLVRVQPDGSWMCVEGIFRGRPIRAVKRICHVCQDGDVFEDLGLEVRNGRLVPVAAPAPAGGASR